MKLSRIVANFSIFTLGGAKTNGNPLLESYKGSDYRCQQVSTVHHVSI